MAYVTEISAFLKCCEMVALLFRLLTVVIIKVTTLLVGDSLKPCYCQDVMHNSPFQSP